MQVYLDKRIFLILLLGFSSGLPLALTASTLSFWLAESGSSNTAIGLFSLVGVAYTFKFVWSPLIDRMPLPGLTRILGRRRSWMFLSQVALILALLAMSELNPTQDLFYVALVASLIAFLSASQDIVIDAYRIDILEEKTYGAGAAAAVFGYRIGMLASGAGALYLASYFSWPEVYRCMALLMGFGLLVTLWAKEPESKSNSKYHNWFYEAVVAPFADFITRPQWATILIFVVLYKLGDAFAGSLTSPFYLQMGFSKIEIANITKVFGVFASLFGVFLGGLFVGRLGVLKALFVCGLLQMFSNLAFVGLAYAGYDLNWLVFVIAIENITGGMGTAALVAYLSKLCHASFSATQYALLSSLTAVGRTFLSAPSGLIADAVSWPMYFLISTGVALPGMLLLVYLIARQKIHKSI